MSQDGTKKRHGADKWKAYSGMAAAFLAVEQNADAQVLYTDVDPDEVLLSSSYAIDFDNDGTVDINFTHVISVSTSSSYTLEIRGALVAGDVIGAVSSSYVYPNALAAGAAIAPGNPEWNQTPYGFMALRFATSSSTGVYGAWPGQTAYLGCRFVSGMGDTHYAWVQLAVDPLVGDMTIMGYAFEATPNTAIVAGDQGTTTSVLDLEGSARMQVFPNPVRDIAVLRLGDDIEGNVSVQVLDAIGRVMQRAELNTMSGSRSIELDLSTLPNGTYFVSVRNGERVMHRKVTKAD
ncbi:MAG: T9SS type A sorting domain-containing protein [Flavobacteriales bacterium]|nr:T9SS type A sorting domain-containing protein [Flavobacteriales bacterium]